MCVFFLFVFCLFVCFFFFVDKTYDDFVAELVEAESKGECRYGVFDAEFELPDGQKRTKLIFFFWY